MTIVPKSVLEKHLPEKLVKAKVDELFGEEYSVTLDVRRDSNDHEVTMTIKNKYGEEIQPATFDENDVMDPIHTAAFVAEVCGLLIENGRITHNKAVAAIQVSLLELYADEIKEAIKNEKDNTNED
jgi:hypothetical protein